MQSPEPPISLGLTAPPAAAPLPAVDDLQFQRAEPLEGESTVRRCAACKQPFADTFYQVGGHDVCPACAERIGKGQEAPPHTSLVRAGLYGGGAALAGCVIYAAVAIITGLEIGLIAILVGIMVGKSIRHASGGLGGRPQQILAVVLTYFAITTSYIPAFISHSMKTKTPAQQTGAATPGAPVSNAATAGRPPMSFGAAIFFLLLLAAAAPFLSLTSGASGILSLVIIFFGLLRAWKLTGRTDLLVLGPYQVTAG